MELLLSKIQGKTLSDLGHRKGVYHIATLYINRRVVGKLHFFRDMSTAGALLLSACSKGRFPHFSAPEMNSLLPLMLVVLLLAKVSSGAFGPASYSTRHEGKVMFKSHRGEGRCKIGTIPSSMRQLRYIPVAVSKSHFFDSHACGACLEIELKGTLFEGRYLFLFGYVYDECDSCRRGTLQAVNPGWEEYIVNYRFITCRVPDVVLLHFKDSNSREILVQPRGMQVPARYVTINGVSATRRWDSFFYLSQRDGIVFPARVLVFDIFGRVYIATLENAVRNKVVRGRPHFAHSR